MQSFPSGGAALNRLVVREIIIHPANADHTTPQNVATRNEEMYGMLLESVQHFVQVSRRVRKFRPSVERSFLPNVTIIARNRYRLRDN